MDDTPRARNLRQEIASLDRKFAELDLKRVASLENCEFAAIDKIKANQDLLVERGERLRAELAEYADE